MVFCWWYLCMYWLWFQACPAESDSWSIEVPHSIVGVKDSCLVIPCRFNFPDPNRKASSFTGIWLTSSGDKVYHPDTSKIISKFKQRTSLMGDLRHRNCSLKISPLHHSDNGPFKFRIEMKDLDSYTYHSEVSITVKDSPTQPSLIVEEGLRSGKKASVTCSVFYSCSSDPPHLTWNRQETPSTQLQQTEGQWKMTSSLSFTPSKKDNQQSLICTAAFSGGKKLHSTSTLSVKYPPESVEVFSRSSVTEGESLTMSCSSDSNPAPHSYQWFTDNGTLVSVGQTYILKRVFRHTEPLYCTAINTEGNASSMPTRLNVTYPPEIKAGSLCRSEIFTVTCLCLVDSNPSSKIKWWGSDPSTVFPSTSIERHGCLTIATLQGALSSLDTVHCHASNSQGNCTMTLQVPINAMVVYISAAVSVCLVIIIGLTVWIAKRSCSRTEVQENHVTHTINNTDMPSHSALERKCKDAFSECGGTEHVYSNMEGTEDCQYETTYNKNNDDDDIYINC